MKNILKISFSKTFEANLNTKDTFLACVLNYILFLYILKMISDEYTATFE